MSNQAIKKNGWKTLTLDKVCRNASRPFNFQDKKEVVFLNTGDVYAGKFLHRDKIKPVGLVGQAKKAIKKNDILFSEIRPANKRYAFVNFDPNDYVVSTKFMVLESFENINNEYLYLILTNDNTLKEFQNIADGRSGSFPQITFDAVANFEIKLPPREEQSEIVKIIKSIVHKIELLQKQNETLEKIAQTIFHEWFVEFNFPNEKSEPYKASGGKMIDSELGEIPEGWKIFTLGDIAEVDWGNTNLTKKSYVDNGEYIGVSAAGCDGRMDHFEYEAFTPVISAIGEYCGKLFLPNEHFTAIKNTLVVKQKHTGTSFFVYIGLMTWGLKRRGAAQPFLSKGDTENIEIALDKDKILISDFESNVKPLFEKIRNNYFQIKSLSKIRDNLLPKLMNGELEVK